MALIVLVVFEAGFAESWLRNYLVRTIAQSTGARVEMGGFHFHLWGLRAEIDNLTLHGLEDASQRPLFHADKINASVRIVSFFGRKFELDKLIVERPETFVEVDRNGRSNVPTPNRPPSDRPWRTTLFQLRVGQLALNIGAAQYNNQRVPLDLIGSNFNFALHYDAPTGSRRFLRGQSKLEPGCYSRLARICHFYSTCP